MMRRPRHRWSPLPAMRPGPPPDEGPVTPGLDVLEQRIGHVQLGLTDAAGGASLCAISRSGGSVPAVKHLEGRLAALVELRRAVRDGMGLEATLVELRDAWRSDLDDVIARDAGADWLAYRSGGVDELEELADRLASPDA